MQWVSSFLVTFFDNAYLITNLRFLFLHPVLAIKPSYPVGIKPEVVQAYLRRMKDHVSGPDANGHLRG